MIIHHVSYLWMFLCFQKKWTIIDGYFKKIFSAISVWIFYLPKFLLFFKNELLDSYKKVGKTYESLVYSNQKRWWFSQVEIRSSLTTVTFYNFFRGGWKQMTSANSSSPVDHGELIYEGTATCVGSCADWCRNTKVIFLHFILILTVENYNHLRRKNHW